MKVSTKLAVGSVLLISILATLLVYHVSTAEENAAEGRRLSAITSRLLLSATDQRYWLGQMEESTAKYRILGDTGYARQFDEYARRFDDALDSYERAPLTTLEAERLARLTFSWRAFRASTGEWRGGGTTSPRPGPAGMSSGFSRPGVPDGSGPTLDTWFRTLRALTDSLAEASRSAMVSRVQAAERRAERAKTVAWVGGATALLVSGAVWFLVVGRLVGGLGSLTAATREVAEGDFDHRLDVDGSDEFAQVARDFNVMTERLGELDRLKRNFVSRVSHDLKSPLASMQEANQILLDGLAGEVSEEQRRFLELSRANGERLRAMISKLLDLSRLEADGNDVALEPHDLRQLTRSTVQRMSPSFRKREVQLDLRVPPEPLSAECDAEQIEQLLENLLENARRFAPEGSSVVVTLTTTRPGTNGIPADRWDELEAGRKAGEAIRMAVADDGPGVEDAEKEKIFTRFHHSVDGRSSGGVGLGLAICREVARAHGGTIWVEDGSGGGAEFVVLVPRRLPSGAAGRPAGERG